MDNDVYIDIYLHFSGGSKYLLFYIEFRNICLAQPLIIISIGTHVEYNRLYLYSDECDILLRCIQSKIHIHSLEKIKRVNEKEKERRGEKKHAECEEIIK